MEENRDLRERTKTFALRIVRMYASLPKTPEAQVLGKQVLKSGTSPGAHYREAYRSRSTAEFATLPPLLDQLACLAALGIVGIQRNGSVDGR